MLLVQLVHRALLKRFSLEMIVLVESKYLMISFYYEVYFDANKFLGCGLVRKFFFNHHLLHSIEVYRLCFGAITFSKILG